VDSDGELIAQLREAVEHRTVIGKALGILMERFELDDDEAFAYLARCSNEQNRKLYDVAVELVDTRAIKQVPQSSETA
jgi:AmiR/NasT family two-component response regulator